MAVALEGLFSDDVFTATDLNRRGGAILDRARKRPVTISRNNEQFALLRRDQAAKLVGTVNRIFRSVALLSEAHTAIDGGQPSDAFKWLEVYEKDDLRKLFNEVLAETRKAAAGECDWDDVDALIHEWRESAAIARGGVLDAAMIEPSDEQPLEAPEEVLRSLARAEAEPSCQTKKD